MEAVIPYLTFEGNAIEALTFYTEALGGRVLYSQTFRQSYMEPDLPEDWKDKVMHAAFQSGDLQLMFSDTPDGQTKVSAGDQLQLALNFTSEQEIDQVYHNLSKEGQITLPLEKTAWGAKFAMVTDKFGIRWMLNFDYADQKEQQ
ncbi:PhnB protein [Arachidicoccus rhizosphaerae]|uniref:PhnB protein n=1 Tax=Arachidicoccus rhizosphaerae TaxID=551991 RepID=A0A1H3VQA8_9BACT|nr:VOC family protein [Arachidicoccus rhizosphaerae]SDZ76993.1 PhnB protein [Arachidicoccus rhizosphaerae]